MKKQYIYAAVSIILWSTLAAFTKKLLGSIPNFQVLFICSLLASLFLLTVNIISGNIKNIRKFSFKDIAIMVGLGFIGLFLYKALYNVGLANLSSQQACVINYLWPIMTVVFSCIIMREKLTFMKVVAMVCSFVGIVILTMGVDASAGKGIAAIGIAGCAIAAAMYGLYSVLNKKTNFNLGISMMISWTTSAVFSLVLGLLTEDWVPVVGWQWGGFLWLGILGDGLAYLTWAMALSSIRNTASIANLAYLTPFLSLIVSAVFLGEPIDINAVIALVFIVGGILLQGIVARRLDKK